MRAGCKRSARPRRLWNRKPKKSPLSRAAGAGQKLAEREEEERRTGKKKRGRKPEAADPEQAKPEDTAQRNFVDPESRIMPDGANKGSFVQGYNAQIAVDSASQVIPWPPRLRKRRTTKCSWSR